MALLGVGTWLFSFSVVGFPSAVIKDFEASPYYFDDTVSGRSIVGQASSNA